jgi:NitT/TauT family transport system permease protein
MLNTAEKATYNTAGPAAGDAVPESFYRKHEHAILAAAGLTAFVIIWELLPALGLVHPLFTSSPSRIFIAAKWLAANVLWADIVVSATEFGIGFALSVAVGVPLGIFLGWYPRWRALFDPLISMLYVTPRVALLPLLILWLGIGLVSKIAVVFLGAVFPILINVIAGMRTIDETLLMCARSFGARDRQIFATLALPTCVPFVLAGLRIGVGRALVGVVVGEMVASTGGIGYMMSVAGAMFQTDRVFVGIFLIALFGYSLTSILNRIERRYESWRPPRS